MEIQPSELILSRFVGGKNVAQPFVRFSGRDELGRAE